ncbi:hypothetical protein BH09DEP1_BH09DEP1_1810 [soil metagenome]
MLKHYFILGAIVCYSNAMRPPRQLLIADEPVNYIELTKTILSSSSEPLLLDACISCGGCPLAVTATITMCPEMSIWYHLGLGSLFSVGLFSYWATHGLPEESASQQLVAKCKKDLKKMCCFTKKVRYE